MTQAQLTPAIDPHYNCVVSASAGTGKTWLLISRLLRLLLVGNEPGSIIAITFTRKAAAEMQVRLADRLRELATCSEETLNGLLVQLEINPDETTIGRARLLYEQQLHHPHSVKTTTYHAFCQELLRRFPLEAGIPPGFELREQTRSLQNEAWDDMFSESTRSSASITAVALEHLFSYCGSLFNVKSALMEFLEHRLDWWLLGEGQQDPLQAAIQRLEQQLPITEWSPDDFFSDSMLQQLLEFQQLLGKHPTKTNVKHVETLQRVFELSTSNDFAVAYRNVIPVFLKKDQTPLTGRKESKTQAGKMGEDGQQQFLTLHQRISQVLVDNFQIQLEITNMLANRAWYIAGQSLLSIYQSIKLSQRVLDFGDLEWHCYQLLQHSDSAQWVQLKLDSRINHILIDEFQDTNPIQWRLVLPLLEEMAAGDTERERSAFIVGDEKQSIYRFRRAEPKLFKVAQQWFSDNLASQELLISKSWRSASAIMNFANVLFSDGPLGRHLPEFPTHNTHFDKLYGRVEVFPLVSLDTEGSDSEPDNHGLPSPDRTAAYFRNPLQQPFQRNVDTRYAREATLIATTINELIAKNTVIGQNDNSQIINYHDILILLRSRAHISDYEHALRTHGIPYSGGDKNGLLDCLEIQDMMALLEILVTPHNNLAIAHVLRSPLFNASHEDLQHMAAAQKSWYEHLIDDSRVDSSPALEKAKLLLPRWHSYASYLPVHDVLDKIYYEGDIVTAYQNVTPRYLRSRVNANLQHFIDLALDLDSGRYPSMQLFLADLQQAKLLTTDAPDQPNIQGQGCFVRILTIHGAKGLEAPVVFLADAARTTQTPKPYQATVDWPISSPTPQQYFMRADKKRQDTRMRATLERIAIDDSQEDAHLLYVAITRPKQLLYISGVTPLKGDDLGWYAIIQSQCEKQVNATFSPNGSLLMESGQLAALNDTTDTTKIRVTDPILRDLPDVATDSVHQQSISPSSTLGTIEQNLGLAADDHKRREAARRGQYIHRAIELLNDAHDQDYTQRQLRIESFQDPLSEDDITEYVLEALAVNAHPDVQQINQAEGLIAAYSEIPISYVDSDENRVSGIIDRLVIYPEDIYIIDYKSHRDKSLTDLQTLAESYRPQMRLYEQGVRQIWGQQRIHLILIFTKFPHIVKLK